MMKRLLFFLLTGLLLSASHAVAAPSGLNLITTADLLGHGEIALEYQNDGIRLFDHDCNHWLLLEIGITDRFELGVDRCFDGETGTFGNVKVLLQPENERRPAVTLGVQNLAEGELAQPYLALAKDVGEARWHVGAIRLEGDVEAMVGLELSLAEPATLVLDHVSGADSASGLGLGLDLSEHVSLLVSRIVSHASEGEDSWQVVVTLATTAGF